MSTVPYSDVSLLLGARGRRLPPNGTGSGFFESRRSRFALQGRHSGLPFPQVSVDICNGKDSMLDRLERLKMKLDGRRIARWLDERKIVDYAAAPLYALDPFQAHFDEVESATYYDARRKTRATPPGESVTVMTWNIKFGGGRIDFWFDGHGDRVILRDWEVLAHLEGVAAKINQVDPDILLLQEVDVDSKRVAYIDQMQWLLDHTKLNFGVYASQWRARLVPTRGLGRIDMGIGILSKYPIDDGQRLALPQMTTQDKLTRYFYLKRAVLTARVDVPHSGGVHVVNTHTEAFSTAGTKERQIELFKSELDRIDAAGGLVVGGGDLNALPPGTQKRHDFDDVVAAGTDFDASDYRSDEGCMTPLYETYEPAVPLDEYRRDNKPHFTHSTSGNYFWSRKLDYLFCNGRFVDGATMTHQDEKRGGMKTMKLSDHAPLSARLELLSE